LSIVLAWAGIAGDLQPDLVADFESIVRLEVLPIET
jgi:hypothetical protein